jgi:ABC-type antimicrobial peptide transport system permease subunit
VAGIFDLLIAAIWERRRELALWRVIGADDAMLRRSIIAESATVGGFGAALGSIVGILTAFIWIRVHFRYLFGFYLEYAFDYRAITIDVLVIVAMTMLAGWIAARYAIGQSVLDGIQVE